MSIADYSQYYQDAGQKYGIDPALLMAQGQYESGGDPKIVSDAGAVGLAQLMPDTAKKLGVTDPTDPKQSIDAQARLMAENINRYGDVNTALKAYHGGTDQSNWGPLTNAYPTQVLKNYKGTQMASNDTNQDPLSAALDAELKSRGANIISSASSSAVDPLSAALDAEIKSRANQPSATAQTAPANSSFSADLTNRLVNNVKQGYNSPLLDIGGAVGGATADAIGKGVQSITPQFVSNALTSVGNTIKEYTPQSVKNALTDVGNFASQEAQAHPAIAHYVGDVGNLAAGVGSVEGVGSAIKGVGNALSSGAQALINPTPTYSKLADVIKTAPDVLGAEVPTQMFASTEGTLQRNAAKAFDTSDLESGINNKLVNLVGANDSGAAHTVLDKDAFADAIKNAGNQYDALHQAIGPVSLEKNYDAISDAFDSVDPSKQSLFSGIKKDFLSKMDENAQMSASDIKDLTGWKTKLDNLSRNLDPSVSTPAQEIKSLLEKSVMEAATPEQADEYAVLDNKYKLLKAMEPISNNLGAAPKIDPAAISKAANRSYNKLTGASNPIQDFRYSLNTLYPNNSAISDVLPEATGLPKGNPLSAQEIAYGLVTGNPQAIALGTATRTAPKIANKISSSIVNSDWYRNKLLDNATHLSTP